MIQDNDYKSWLTEDLEEYHNREIIVATSVSQQIPTIIAVSQQIPVTTTVLFHQEQIIQYPLLTNHTTSLPLFSHTPGERLWRRGLTCHPPHWIFLSFKPF